MTIVNTNRCIYVLDTINNSIKKIFKKTKEGDGHIAECRLDTEPLITHTYPLAKIKEAYKVFENKRNGVIKVAVDCINLNDK